MKPTGLVVDMAKMLGRSNLHSLKPKDRTPWNILDKDKKPVTAEARAAAATSASTLAMGEEEAKRKRSRSMSGSGTIMGDAEKFGG